MDTFQMTLSSSTVTWHRREGLRNVLRVGVSERMSISGLAGGTPDRQHLVHVTVNVASLSPFISTNPPEDL